MESDRGLGGWLSVGQIYGSRLLVVRSKRMKECGSYICRRNSLGIFHEVQKALMQGFRSDRTSRGNMGVRLGGHMSLEPCMLYIES